MYLEHFGLSACPFSTTPDPRFYYPSAKHREALACLLYAVEQRKGFALVSGEVGAGKSMLCRAAVTRFGDQVDTALLVHTSLTAKQFFQAVASEFGIALKGKSKFELIHNIKDFLLDRQRMNRTAVLIVDEAQNLGRDVLEEVRQLGNLETESEKLVQIILVGQPELRALIGTPDLRQLNQRITVKFHLGALSVEDVAGYVDHRLQVAGASETPLFDEDAKIEVYKASGGVPRLVNVVCDQALLEAFVNDRHEVGLETIRKVISEMDGYYMDAPTEIHAGARRTH